MLAREAGGRIVVHCDAAAPGAWRRAPYYAQIKAWATKRADGSRQEVVVLTGNRITFLAPEGEFDLGQRGPGEADAHALRGERQPRRGAARAEARVRRGERRRSAMTVYALAQLTIHDRARYDRYQSRFMEVLKRHKGRVLAADESPQVVEGSWGAREGRAALVCRRSRVSARSRKSADYQAIAVDRLAGADAVVLLVKGIDAG